MNGIARLAAGVRRPSTPPSPADWVAPGLTGDTCSRTAGGTTAPCGGKSDRNRLPELKKTLFDSIFQNYFK